MSILSYLVLEMYWNNSSNGKGVGKSNEDLIKKQLDEINRWAIKSIKSDGSYGPIGYSFKPKEEPKDTEYIPIEVRLAYDNLDDSYELKFGNLNAETEKARYYYDKDDKYKMQKALFVKDVLEGSIFYSLLQKNKINKIKFKPYDGDNLGSNRLDMFKKIYKKLNTNDDYSMLYNEDFWYIKKIK